MLLRHSLFLTMDSDNEDYVDHSADDESEEEEDVQKPPKKKVKTKEKGKKKKSHSNRFILDQADEGSDDEDSDDGREYHLRGRLSNL